MGKLTLAVVGDLAEEEDTRKLTKLDASKQGITEVDDLSSCTGLTRLDLSYNSISKLDGILCCQALTWLDLSHNQLESLEGVQSLTNLVVLNASHNTLETFGDLSPLENLKALLLNNNKLSELLGLSSLRELNTLVLFQNCFKSLSLKKLSKLTKLSLSHNSLRAIPDTQHNPDLRELRLNGNKISVVPESVQSNTRLTLLDLGNNKIKAESSLENLRELRRLKNLNLKGNKICDADDYQQQISDVAPSVKILDSRKRDFAAIQRSSQKREDIAPQERQSGKKLTKKEQHGSDTEGGLSSSLPTSPHPAVTAMSNVGGDKDKRKRKRKHLECDEGTVSTTAYPKKPKLSKEPRAEKMTTSKKHLTSDSGETDKGVSEVISHKARKKRKIAADKGITVKSPRKSHPETALKILEQASDFAISAEGGLTNAYENGYSQATIGKKDRDVMDTKTKKFKGHSGVVAVEEIRKKRRGKKHRPLLVEMVDFESELGSGQISTWT